MNFWRSVDRTDNSSYSLQHNDLSCCSINSDALSIFQPCRCLMYTHYCRDTIFARDNRSMSHHATHFGDQSTRCHEERSPGGVSAGADEDFTWDKMCTARIEHHMDNSFRDAR